MPESKIDLNSPSKRLIYLLKKTGYNGPELADRIPVSVSTISRWFNDDSVHIDQGKRGRICELMGFDNKWVEESLYFNPVTSTERDVLLRTLRDQAKNLYEGLDKLIQIENEN